MDLPEKQNVGKSNKSKAMGGNQTQKYQSFFGLPPPPFAANMRPSRDDKTFLGHNIICLPVKVLGIIGYLDEDMPRSSKGLPEVVSMWMFSVFFSVEYFSLVMIQRE